MPTTPFTNKENLHLLIADDDQDDIEFFKGTLDDITKDIQISIVQNGAELMEFLNSTVPDIIILDVNMPCKTGIECLSEIRQIHSLGRVPVVIYSIATNEKQVDKTFELGANLYFEKPSTYQGMKDGLTKILSYSIQTLMSEVSRDRYVIRA